MRVLVTGSRKWTDKGTLFGALDQLLTEQNLVIVHGDCPTGADAMAQEWADIMEVKTERHPADWNQHGKSAGPRRNQKMVNLGADKCIAFPTIESVGTVHCMDAARKAGIQVETVEARHG